MLDLLLLLALLVLRNLGVLLPPLEHFDPITAHVADRNVRRDGIEMLKRREKDAEISQDQQRKQQQEIQHLTDDYIRRIDEALTLKDREILQV